MFKIALRFISFVTLVALLTACGTATDNTATTPSSAAASVAASSAAAPSEAAAVESAVVSPEASTAASTEASPAGSAEATATEAAGDGTLTIYSGRNEELVGPLIQQFEQGSGIDVEVRYGDTAELAATILEEGDNSPADVFFAQDAGALGAVQNADRFEELPDEITERVDERFRSDEDEWVGVSGRARVVVFNTNTYTTTDLPDSIFGYTDPKFRGRIGWAPTNGSFQAFVTALRVIEGEDRAREWLEGIQANEPKVYENNTAVVNAAASGEIDVGFVNHYYLFRLLAENGEGFGARNYYFTNGDPGSLVNVAGAGVLTTSDNKQAADQFVEFLLSDEAQQYFADETYEYPLVEDVEPNEALPALDEIETPDIDLSDLSDLQGTVQLLQDLGIL
jgi:iron(III) transport system substrate-binding protein